MNNFAETDVLSRRALLEFGAAASVLGGTSFGALAAEPSPETGADLLKRFREQRARVDGKPVFWLTRGTELAVFDGKAVPTSGRVVISATRFIDLGGGVFDIPYVETTCTTEHSTYRYIPDLVSPITGKAVAMPLPAVKLLKLHLDKDGVMTQEVSMPGERREYRGMYFGQQGFDGETWITQKYILNMYRGADVRTLIEIKTTIPRGKVKNGFLPADSQTTVYQSRIPELIGGGANGIIVSYYYSRKYATEGELRVAMGPQMADLTTDFFAKWKQMLP